jgi:hypothetical protein
MEEQISNYIGGQVWWITGLALLFLVRNLIESAIQGILVFIGSDYDTDDVVFLDGEPARIIRVGIYKSVFFVYDIKKDIYTGKAFVNGGSKRVIQNAVLATAKIDKPLQSIDLSLYDKPEKDPNCRRNGNGNGNGNGHNKKRRRSDD